MGILKILLSEITTPDVDMTEQIRTICDQIMEQEKHTFKYPELHPKGGSVFLSLEVPGRYDKEIGVLTLEREDVERYVAVFLTLEKYRINEENMEDTVPPRRRKVWVIDENKAEKILTQFAIKLKMLRGE